ncbi:hypothetical protein [Clostridium sp. YIM B02500]|uniref:hypothetical protein n=1 Tax=Clostridium sp. YIM B02500 TaxID=2910681 RepID=UPI0031B81875
MSNFIVAVGHTASGNIGCGVIGIVIIARTAILEQTKLMKLQRHWMLNYMLRFILMLGARALRYGSIGSCKSICS